MTPRQKQLLAAIIEEFIDTAGAVGSVSLYDKYRFNVSPATIRNEMAALTSAGYLSKPHSSAGRVPTTLGLRTFVQDMLEVRDDLDVVSRERLKQEFFSLRFERENLIRHGLSVLTSMSRNAAIALAGKNIYYGGLAEMLSVPEFQELDNLRSVLVTLEDYSALSSIFQRYEPGKDVNVLIGEEMGDDAFTRYAVVFAPLKLHGGERGFISVIGPNRMDYARIIPAVKYIGNTISGVVSGW